MEQEKSKRIINCHFIGVVKEVNDSLKYFEVEIPQDDILIEEFLHLEIHNTFRHAEPLHFLHDSSC